MSYSLTINGENQGGFVSLDAVYHELNQVYESPNLDLFDDVSWELRGPDQTVSRTMCPNDWEAHCESAYAFKLWLELFN